MATIPIQICISDNAQHNISNRYSFNLNVKELADFSITNLKFEPGTVAVTGIGCLDIEAKIHWRKNAVRIRFQELPPTL